MQRNKHNPNRKTTFEIKRKHLKSEIKGTVHIELKKNNNVRNQKKIKKVES